MKPRISVVTIGVDNLDVSLRFYRDGLGLQTEGIIGQEFEHGAVVFFDLQYGVKLALFPREDIARDAEVEKSARSPTEFTLGQVVSSEAEVDTAMSQAKAAGARIVKVAQKTFWGGYAGYFEDPDGHLWEIAYNPAFLPND
jgi:catechol 2,3-dioxygenase-like lactoylglutathione lyase family enzyme